MCGQRSGVRMDTEKFGKYLAYCRWVWLVGSAVSLLAALASVAVWPGAFLAVLTVISVVQAALAIPAAIVLPQRKPWARVTLMVLALLCIGSLYSAFKAGAWPSVVLNLVLGSTYGVLADKRFKAAYQGTASATASREA